MKTRKENCLDIAMDEMYLYAIEDAAFFPQSVLVALGSSIQVISS